MSTTHFQNNVIINGTVMLAKTGGTTAIGLTDPVIMTQLGQIIVANDNTTSSTTTGSIKTAGGIGVVGNIYVGGTSNVNGTTTMGASTPVLVGGFGVTVINNVTESTTTSTGCLQVKGGIGVLKNVNIGGSAQIAGTLNNTVIDTNTGNSIIIGTSTTGAAMDDAGALDNILIGDNAGNDITTGDYNIIMGDNAGDSITTSSYNIAMGQNALGVNTNVNGRNVAIGTSSLNANTTGYYNIGVGMFSLSNNVSGFRNVAIGNDAGNAPTSGNNNVFIGDGSDGISGNNQIAIGQSATCDLANQCTIGNSALTIIRPGANNTCDLGESDRGFKDAYISGTIVGGNLWNSTLFATNNVAAGTATYTMPRRGNPGHILEFFVPFNSTITKMYFQIDDVGAEFNTWTTGSLTVKLYVDGVLEYTSANGTGTAGAYLKADFTVDDGFYALVIDGTLDVDVDADSGIRVTVDTIAVADAGGMELGAQFIMIPRI